MIDLSLSGITMIHCGVQGANRGFSGREVGFPYFALHVFEGLMSALASYSSPTVLKLGCCVLMHAVLRVCMTQ